MLDDHIPAFTPPTRRSRAEMNAEIQRLMGTQGGFASYRQLRALGLSSKAVARKVANGELVAVSERPVRRRGGTVRSTGVTLAQRVYAANRAEPSPDGRRWRAVLSAPTNGALTHVSTCAAMGVGNDADLIHVIHEGAGWDGPAGVRAHRARRLPPSELTHVNGVPSVTFARAMLDAAVDLEPEYIDARLDRAIAVKVFDEEDMRRVLKDRASFPTAPKLNAALDRIDERSGEFRSEFERKTTRLIQRSTRIPVPVVNVLVPPFRPDLRFQFTRAILECDGRDYHRSLAQVIADGQREEILWQMGYEILRLRWHQVVYEPERALARIEEFVLANQMPPVPR